MTTRVPLNMAGALAPSGGSDTAALQAAAQTLQDGTARMQVIPHTGAAAAGPAVPITWATGDEVRASITYSV